MDTDDVLRLSRLVPDDRRGDAALAVAFLIFAGLVLYPTAVVSWFRYVDTGLSLICGAVTLAIASHRHQRSEQTTQLPEEVHRARP